MKQREKRNIIIGLLCCMIVFMSVGYAILSQNLKITGTANITGSWDIQITKIVPTKEEKEGKSLSAVVGEDGISASFSADLKKPGSLVEYTVTVENKGTIDAELNGITENWKETGEIKFETVGLTENCSTLPAQSGNSSKCQFEIKVEYEYKENEKQDLLDVTVENKFALEYVQAGKIQAGPSGSGGGEVEIEASPFKVTSDGVLFHYDRVGSETSVVVPAEVNGVKIKKIDTAAFVSGDVMIFYDNNAMILLNNAYEEKAQGYANDSGMNLYYIDDFGKGNDPVELTGTGVKNFIKDGAPTTSTSHEENYYLTSIDLSGMSYLEEIGTLAFGGGFDDDNVNSNLASVKLPQNGALTTIGDFAFTDCVLSSISIPNTVVTIGSQAFSHSGLTGTVILPSSLQNIGYSAFSDNGITNVIFEEPSKLTKLNDRLFEANSISKVTIPASVTTIGRFVFNSSALTEVTVLGDSTRFDSNWSSLFGSATKGNTN